jgi:hypothetical protein
MAAILSKIVLTPAILSKIVLTPAILSKIVLTLTSHFSELVL